MAAYVKSMDVDLASNSKFIQVNDSANIGNIREGWPVFINQNLVGFAKVINTSANPPTIELYELYSGTAITAGNMSTFPSQGAITAIGDRITSLANTYESLSDSVAVNPVANSLVKRTGTGARVKTGNATENDDAVTLGQMGTVFDKNVTTSVTDTTSGRLLKVGDFGVGSALENAISDLNTITANGWYRVASGVNRPSDSDASGDMVCHQQYDSNAAFQVYKRFRNNTTFVRNKAGGVWGSWQKIFHQANILGTVSQSAGVPTGAIIERGSNANGEYVKFADGTLFCWPDTRITTVGGTLTDGFYFEKDITPYPAKFSDTPSFVIMPQLTGFEPTRVSRFIWFRETGVEINPSDNAYVTFGSTNSGDILAYKIIAIGSWY